MQGVADSRQRQNQLSLFYFANTHQHPLRFAVGYEELTDNEALIATSIIDVGRGIQR